MLYSKVCMVYAINFYFYLNSIRLNVSMAIYVHMHRRFVTQSLDSDLLTTRSRINRETKIYISTFKNPYYAIFYYFLTTYSKYNYFLLRTFFLFSLVFIFEVLVLKFVLKWFYLFWSKLLSPLRTLVNRQYSHFHVRHFQIGQWTSSSHLWTSSPAFRRISQHRP